MDAATIEALGKAGGAAALGLAAVGSSIGAGLA
ncbi:MAG TPA: V-type ATP synthase subunit K, partial [Verrucomicrobia bacterium]|nr:V-type ATP synthase subunit K [Verrucomicrobiota bacterium]